MASRLKRIVSRGPNPDPTDARQPSEQMDSLALLPQVREGLATLRETQIELNRREHDLLAHASELYDRLTATAHQLAGVRQQQAATSVQVDKLLEALHLLEQERIGMQPADHNDPARREALVVQPKL